MGVRISPGLPIHMEVYVLGSFDILIDGDKLVQVKCFSCDFDRYTVGDKVPDDFGKTFTIVLPYYEGAKFAVVKNGKLAKLTDDESETLKPYITKWGEEIESPDEFRNPFEEIIEKAKEKAGVAQ